MPSTETGILAISDLHYGKRIAGQYDVAESEAVCERLGEKLGQMARMLRGAVRLDGLEIVLLGDMVDGHLVYPTQAHHQADSNPESQARRAAAPLAKLALRARSEWGPVRIRARPGNHGRSGWTAAEAANFDIVLYRYLQDELRPDGIEVEIADRYPFVRPFTVHGHKILAFHGESIRSYQSIPWYGLFSRLLRWHASREYGAFEAAVHGHFHTLGSWHLNAIKAFATGTAVRGDPWSLHQFGLESATAWWLIGVAESRLPTWQFALELYDEHAEPARAEGEASVPAAQEEPASTSTPPPRSESSNAAPHVSAPSPASAREVGAPPIGLPPTRSFRVYRPEEIQAGLAAVMRLGNVRAAAREIGVPPDTLQKWVARARAGKLPLPDQPRN